MCLIAFRPQGTKGAITPAQLDTSRQWGNDDSYGIMWADSGKLLTWRGMKDSWKEFLEQVEALNRLPVPFAVHLRLATHGATDLANCHPFEVLPDKLALMHNGVLREWQPTKGDSRSDTALLVETLRNLPRHWWRNPNMRRILASAVGYSNRLALLSNTGEAVLINEGLGLWKSGVWFSNDSFRETSAYFGAKYSGGEFDYSKWLPKAWKEEDKRSASQDQGDLIGYELGGGEIVCLPCMPEMSELGFLAKCSIFSETVRPGESCALCGIELGPSEAEVEAEIEGEEWESYAG